MEAISITPLLLGGLQVRSYTLWDYLSIHQAFSKPPDGGTMSGSTGRICKTYPCKYQTYGLSRRRGVQCRQLASKWLVGLVRNISMSRAMCWSLLLLKKKYFKKLLSKKTFSFLEKPHSDRRNMYHQIIFY